MPPRPEIDVRKYLMAFADGELDVERNLAVLERMTMDPSATRRVMHQQQLQQAVERCMTGEHPPMPESLRARIRALADEADRADRTDRAEAARAFASSNLRSIDPSAVAPAIRPTVIARLRRWTPAIAAAILFSIGLASLYQANLITHPATPGFPGYPGFPASSDPTTSGGGGGGGELSVLPAAMVQRFARRHSGCEAGRDLLHEGDLPQNLAELPAALTAYLGDRPDASLDLSGIGYVFDRVGPCTLPGGKSVHLIYRSISDRSHALSLWIKPDDGKLALRPDLFYQATTPASSDRDASFGNQPMVVWRHAGMIYYLIGGEPAIVRDASAALATVAYR